MRIGQARAPHFTGARPEISANRVVVAVAAPSQMTTAIRGLIQPSPRSSGCIGLNSVRASFYGWNQTDRFIAASRAAGFRQAGHFVFPKNYASSIRKLSNRRLSAGASGNEQFPLDQCSFRTTFFTRSSMKASA